MRKVFPDRQIVEIDNPDAIFHTIYDLSDRYQVPGAQYLRSGQTYEQDGYDPHWRGIYDDKGRIMVMICHNTDLGDGWEREGENEYYFREFSEKKAFPLGINIIYYAMTH